MYTPGATSGDFFCYDVIMRKTYITAAVIVIMALILLYVLCCIGASTRPPRPKWASWEEPTAAAEGREHQDGKPRI